ncbi:hypothetical protein [Streptomyces acidicola]|uniref:hypothetical protein n=1 Tax=Streptomyces acidicola TaxID=2596892 RepID=UPI0034471629
MMTGSAGNSWARFDAIEGIDLSEAKTDLRPSFPPEVIAGYVEELCSVLEWSVPVVEAARRSAPGAPLEVRSWNRGLYTAVRARAAKSHVGEASGPIWARHRTRLRQGCLAAPAQSAH